MDAILAWLNGNKTHIGIVLSAILVALQTEEWVPDSWQPYVRIASIIVGALTANAARSAVTKLQTGQVELAGIQMDSMKLGVNEQADAISKTDVLKAVFLKENK